MTPTIFKTWKRSRELYRDILSNHSLEELNKVPSGFRNSIAWNIAHITVAQQVLVYKGSGLPMNITDAWFEAYKPGSVPVVPATEADVEMMKELLFSQIAQTEQDLAAGRFQQYEERVTITGFHLANLEEAMAFNNYHEGIHLGYIQSLRKLV